MKRLFFFSTLLLFNALPPTPLKAATKTWTGLAETGEWSDGANWSDGVAPQDGDSYLFYGGTGSSNRPPYATANIQNLPNGTVFSGIEISGYHFNIGQQANQGNDIRLDGDINRRAGGNSNIYAKIELLRDVTINVESHQLTLYRSAISGNYGIVKVGQGMLTLRDSNAFTGGIVLQEGELGVAGTRGGTHLGTGALTITGGTFLLTGADTTITGLKGTGGNVEARSGNDRTLTINGSNTGGDVYEGTIQNGEGEGVLSITKEGSGTQTLSGESSYTGTTLINGGTLLIDGRLGETAVRVNALGALGGDGGFIEGAVEVHDTGSLTFSLGTTSGTGLTLGKSLSLSSDSNLRLELRGAVNKDDVYTLLLVGEALTGRFATVNDAAFGDGDTFSLAYGGQSYDFRLTYGADSIFVTAVTGIPEPPTALLLGAALGGILWRWNRLRVFSV